MNKKVILFIVIALVVGSIYYLESTKISVPKASPTSFKDGEFPLAPELVGIGGYLNAEEGIKIEDYRGKVVLIDFWTYTCINCIRTLPHLTAWDEKYRDDGLVIIGVHTPEFEFEKVKSNVQAALDKYGIKYAVVQDNNYGTWNAYQNRYWPHKFLIDSEGYIRYDHIGEGGYAETEREIQKLLEEIDELEDTSLTNVEDTTPTTRTTPELYAGYGFALPKGQNIGNEGGLQAGVTTDHVFSEILSNIIYLRGLWKSNPDDLEAKGESNIFLAYTAETVNIVADADFLEMDVRLDGKYITSEFAGDDVQFSNGRAFVIVDEARLYNVVNGKAGSHLLDLKVDQGFIFNAFTFG